MDQKKRNILIKLLRRFNEYLPLLIALPVWWFSGRVTRMIDPTAGVDDAGLFQALVFGLVLYFAACAFSWMAMRIVFPTITRFVDNYIASVFVTKLRDHQRVWVALALFAIYFFGAIMIFSSVIYI